MRIVFLTYGDDNEWSFLIYRRFPVIGSRAIEKTTAADVITDSVNGFVTEERVDAYAEKIVFLLTHPEEVERAGRAAFRSLYTPWGAVMEKVARLYTGIIARGRT